MKGIKVLIIAWILPFVGCNPKEILHRPSAVMQSNVGTLNYDSTKVMSINQNPTTSFFDLKAETIDGETIAMSAYKGKKIIILNVASECGYTPQYEVWEKFYKANSDKVVILGFPCNQFGGQESGSNGDIKSFCQKNYGVSFPMFSKIDVKGSNKSPVYAWLTDKSKNGWCEKEPTWNFCKYLINEKGELLDFFASGIKPDNADFLADFSK